jgi:DNA polymerase I-like protein with 3'-5' exonuclease and polymerase domains
LIDAYRNGDVYHALARICGLTDDPDRKHWKETNPEMRWRMKALQLGINYGMGVPSLAKGLDRHPLIASTIIETHKRTYPRFWQWRDDIVWDAMLTRRMESVFGWPLRVSTSPNKRTLYNFPMQANGAEMLRLAAWRLCEAGIVPCMLIHDGILLEVRDEEQIELAKEIMRAAGRDVCDGLEVGVDVDQRLANGARYQDKRKVAQQMWATVMRASQEIGAAAPEMRAAS